MKLSICIPQYNRIEFLLKSLSLIELQTYSDLEIVISDDCSTDNTESEIRRLIPIYKYPVVYHRNIQNMGYDRNYRKCVELAGGEYVIIIGNDDTINPAHDIGMLVQFLKVNNWPEVGFCNFIEESTGDAFIERAHSTDVLGTGYITAMRYYSCFSFVGGLIYKRDVFNKFNSDKHDGSIYAQMYMGCYMVASGFNLFSVHEPLVIKDIVLEQIQRNSYRDTLPKNWKQYRTENGGLPSVMNVLIDAFRDSNVLSQSIIYSIFKRIYTITFPFWIVDYKENGSIAAAVGLISGLNPRKNSNLHLLTFVNQLKIWFFYILMSTGGLLMPVKLFKRFKNRLYKRIKRQ